MDSFITNTRRGKTKNSTDTVKTNRKGYNPIHGQIGGCHQRTGSPHSHAPNREEVKGKKIVERLKRHAMQHPDAPPAQVLRTELRSVPAEVLPHIPERESLKKTVRRSRLKGLPRHPTTLQELEQLPDRNRHTLSGETFLIYDSFDDLQPR